MASRVDKVSGSSLVTAMAYDEPARRIYVRLRPNAKYKGAVWWIADSERSDWQTFFDSDSKGEWFVNVLARHPHGRANELDL
jgi:hypothetical protein